MGEIKSDINTTGRIRELQQKFRDLEPEIEDSNIKEALSVMNGMIQELMRTRNLEEPKSGFSLKNIADIYKNAPRMQGAAVCEALPAGTRAPDFSLLDANGDRVSLSNYKGSTVLLVFYPLDWSPGCSQQLDIYQQESGEFNKRGVRIIGVSVDSIYSHGAWAVVRGLNFPLLSDFNPRGEIAARYRVFRDQDGFSERALFIIDKTGYIRYSYVSPYLNHIPDIYELFEKIETINSTITV